MTSTLRCPDCGAELPENAPKGLCPACLVALASAAWLEEDSPEADEANLVGDYQLLGEISRGGMGVVFRARQRNLKRLVAVKMIRGGHLAGAGEIQRFRMEAEAAANLDHPNIVPIYEIGEHMGQPFFSMKLIEGQSLAEQIASGQWNLGAGAPPERQHAVARLMAKVARAVQHAHERGVLHRDLKPSNILLDEHSEPHLTDFGLAKLVERDYGQTLSQAVLGTPSYMSPEQAAGKSKSITTAADIYSLGAILYEVLAGQPPFRGESTQEILQQVQERDPAGPRLLNPGVASDLETICLKCLEKEPRRRYSTAEALAQDLERWLEGKPITARPVGSLERARKWLRRNPTPARVTAAVGLCLVLGSAGFTWLWHLAKQKEVQKEMQQVEDLFAKDDGQLALATLARLLRNYPAYRVAPERLVNALAQRSFLVPAAPVFPDRPRLAHWSSDGRYLLLAGTNAQGSLVMVCEQNGKLVAELPQGFQALHTADISADGKMVATGTDDRVRVWEVSRKQVVLDRASPTGAVRQVQFLPQGQLLVVAGDRVSLWDLADGRAPREFKGEATLVLCAAVAPKANLLAAAFDTGVIRLWRLDSGELLHAGFTAHTKVIRDLQFSPDGTRLVSAGADWTARIWDARTGQRVAECVHSGAVYAASFSPDSARVITASRDQTARVWDANNGELLRSLLRHSDSLNSAGFSPDGRQVVTASDDGTVRVWDSATGLQVTEPARFNQAVLDACFSPDGRDLVIVVENEGACLLTPTPRQMLWQVGNIPPPPASARLPEDERRVFERTHAGDLNFLDLSLDGRLVVTASADKTARIWYRKTRKPATGPLLHDAAVNCARFSPDSRRVVSSSASRKFRVWDVDTGAPLTDWIESGGPVASVWFSPEGSTVLTDGGRAWSIAVVSGQVPPWLPALAEAVAGFRLNERGSAEAVPANTFLELRGAVVARSEAGPLSAWVRQFLAVPAEQPGVTSTGGR